MYLSLVTRLDLYNDYSMKTSMNGRMYPQYKRESDILKELEYQFGFNFTLGAY